MEAHTIPFICFQDTLDCMRKSLGRLTVDFVYCISTQYKLDCYQTILEDLVDLWSTKLADTVTFDHLLCPKNIYMLQTSPIQHVSMILFVFVKCCKVYYTC